MLEKPCWPLNDNEHTVRLDAHKHATALDPNSFIKYGESSTKTIGTCSKLHRPLGGPGGHYGIVDEHAGPHI